MVDRANSLFREIEDEMKQTSKAPSQPFTNFSATSYNDTEKTELAHMQDNFEESDK